MCPPQLRLAFASSRPSAPSSSSGLPVSQILGTIDVDVWKRVDGAKLDGAKHFEKKYQKVPVKFECLCFSAFFLPWGVTPPKREKNEKNKDIQI